MNSANYAIFSSQSISRFLGILPTVLGFSTTKKESLNNALSSQKDAKFLIRVAVNITQLREKQQVYLFGQEICTTLHDKETPLAEGSVFDDPCT